MTKRSPAGLAAVIALAGAGLLGLLIQAVGQPANHPQIEAVHSAVSRLERGDAPSAVVPGGVVDISRSNNLFLIVTDADGKVLASSASVGDATVVPPPGVFDYVRKNGEDRVTWQPADGVRLWIVVDSFHSGFVIAGRSPTAVEQDVYLLLLWGSFAALGLAVVLAVPVVLRFL